MLKYIFKPIGFVITNFFTLLFICGVFAFLATPTGRRVGSVIAKEASNAAIELPQQVKSKFTKSTYTKRAFNFIGSQVYGLVSQLFKGAVNTFLYYVGSLGMLLLVIYIIYRKF